MVVKKEKTAADRGIRPRESNHEPLPFPTRSPSSRWLCDGSLEKPGDLGYWVGWRIVKSYWEHASDKRQTLADMYAMTDAHAFLRKSGWYPGMRLAP